MDHVEPPTDVWTDPRLVVGRSAIDGSGLAAAAGIEAGTVVIELGGRLVSPAELAVLLDAARDDPDTGFVDTITVFEDRHLVLPPGTVAHFGNHSCDPTMWHVGPYRLATRRDVAAGEELTVDYGTHSGAVGFVMPCRCGSRLCRREVTGSDWMLPELRRRYGTHWTPALRRRIEAQPGSTPRPGRGSRRT